MPVTDGVFLRYLLIMERPRRGVEGGGEDRQGVTGHVENTPTPAAPMSGGSVGAS